MIGMGLKKLAQENGMQISHGVAYGSLKGYAVTLSEGSGYKSIVITTKFADPVGMQQLQQMINSVNVTRQYRVQQLVILPDGIRIVFIDNPGTMKKINEFIDWFFPQLAQYTAMPVNVCSECGSMITGGCWKLIDGVAYHLHEGCAEKVRQQLEADHETRQQEATGSYALGAVGAMLGAAVGSILWAIVLSIGYVASIVGLAIGFLAEKGYTLLKGKQGKAKVVILIVAVIFGVLLGNFLADAFVLFDMIQNGELPYDVADIPLLILAVFMEDGDYRGATIGNILMGLLFAGLGVFALLHKTAKEVSAPKFQDLP